MLFKPSLTLFTISVILLSFACKSQKVDPMEYSIIVEMDQGMSVQEIKALEDVTILKFNRSNRTLNQWIVQVSATISQEELTKNLKKESRIIDVQPVNQKPNTITTSTNEKKVKSKPTKND